MINNIKKAYQYTKIPLTPKIAATIILEHLKPNLPIERTEIISKISNLHLREGGKVSNNYTAIIKKALKYLKDNGKIENVSTGYWMIKQNNNIEQDIDVENESSNIEYIPKEIFDIYLYYFHSYKELANIKGQTIWQCKIGKTERNVQERISSQIATGYPEKPHIESIYKAKDSRDCHTMEVILHNILKRHNREVKNKGNKEWFLTNLDEVKQIIQGINKIKLTIEDL